MPDPSKPVVRLAYLSGVGRYNVHFVSGGLDEFRMSRTERV